MYKATNSGWSQVNFGKELYFNTGTAEISEGATVSGANSSASGTVARVILESGTYSNGDAAGRLILSSDSGTFELQKIYK